MINFNGNYIAENMVVQIAPLHSGKASHPYRIEIRTKDGYKVCTDYVDEKSRNNTIRLFASQVDRAMHDDSLSTKLYIIDKTLERIEKRQKRIQKLLKMEGEADA